MYELYVYLLKEKTRSSPQ